MKKGTNASLRKKIPKALRIILVSASIFCVSPVYSSVSYPTEGIVAAVYDGDTVRIRFGSGMEKSVRIIGVDAPELDALNEEAALQALFSKRFAFFYLYRKKVTLSYDWELEDKHGRLLAYISTENLGLFNAFIIKEGFASAFLKYPFHEDYRKEFKEAEREARILEKGLWKKPPFPVISSQEAAKNTGKLCSVRYVSEGIKLERNFVFLNSPEEEFAALIPRDKLSSFPGIKDWEGRVIQVSGFLESFRGQPQIMVVFPCQVEIPAQEASHTNHDAGESNG